MVARLSIMVEMNVVLRYHEIALKGRNRPVFVEKLAGNARRLLADLGGRVHVLAGRLRVDLPDDVPWAEAERRLGDLFGVANFSRAHEVPPDFNWNGEPVYKGRGCRECRNSGYKGRKGLFELLVMDDDIRELILERSSSGKIKKKALEHGMIVLRDDGWQKVRDGLTTISEVVQATKG